MMFFRWKPSRQYFE